MDEQGYWELVATAREQSAVEDVADIAEHFMAELETRSPEEIIAADLAYRELSLKAHTLGMWGAAALINSGCAEDAFDNFRGWLIAQGREVFEAAVANPDSLADVVVAQDQGETFSEDMLTSAWSAYLRKTGEELPLGEIIIPDELGPRPDFDDEDYLFEHYPRLSAIFLD